MAEEQPCSVPIDYHRASCTNHQHFVNGKRPMEEVDDDEDEFVAGKFPRQSDIHERVNTSLTLGGSSLSRVDKLCSRPEMIVSPDAALISPSVKRVVDQEHSEDSSESSSLIPGISRDNSISCLVYCSRSDYSSISALNRSFRSLMRSDEIYKLRRMNGIVEHWIYISCNLREWEAFDPNRRRWKRLPLMDCNECFLFSDKLSLAVGTELLVFGNELLSQLIYRYSLLTNSWSSGMQMNEQRFLFGSSSCGEIAIFAGGCDSQGKILSSVELYNSETGTWTLLPNMNKARKMCSGVFSDGKFYVIGGVGGPDSKPLTCGEEYDFVSKTWTLIPNMAPTREARENELPAQAEPSPLITVLNDQFYCADYVDKELKKYDKVNRVWTTIGRLPESADSVNGWGLGFRSCGDKLIVVGGPRTGGQGFIEVNSWAPSEGPPQWNLLGRKLSGSFVYNCAVMGC